VNQLKVGEVPVRLPAVQIHSVGAGGGSIAWVDEQGALHVGPRSAGAYPGPACYGRGGTRPTVTDCHVVLGRLPHASQLGGFLELLPGAAHDAVSEHLAEPLGLSVEEAAQGVLDIAAAEMEGAIRVLLRERGSDPRDFALLAFGGAGPLQAVDLAARLGAREVLIPLHPGTFSASGLAASDVRHGFAASCAIRSDAPDAGTRLGETYSALEAEARAWFAAHAGLDAEPRVEYRCDVRYVGQAYDVSVSIEGSPSDPATLARLAGDFETAHERAFAFSSPGEPCEIRTVRVFLNADAAPRREDAPAAVRPPDGTGHGHTEAVIDGRRTRCAVLERDTLAPGEPIPVPCVIVQTDTTIFVPPGVRAHRDDSGTLVIAEIPAA
jgi:N-methylhydantoinase A